MSSTNVNYQAWITRVRFPGHIAVLTVVGIAVRVGAIAILGDFIAPLTAV